MQTANITLQAIFEIAYSKGDNSFGNGHFARTIPEYCIEQQDNCIADYVGELDDAVISLITAADLGISEL